MKTNSKRGAVWLLPVIIGVLVGGFGLYGIKKVTDSGNPAATAAGKALEKNLSEQDKVDAKIIQEKFEQNKIGQQYVTAESVAIQHVKSDEPAVKLLGQLNSRANLAFNNGLGPLDVAQQDWATKLVLNSLSEEVEKRALAEVALKKKDGELQGSITDVKNLGAQNIQLRDENKVLSAKLIAEDASAVAFRNKVYWGVGIVLFIVIGLPILSAAFPILGGLTNGLGAIISPFLHKAKVRAEGLAHDAVGALHEIEQQASKVGVVAQKDLEQIKSGWIGEAHKNVHAFDEARRKLNLI